MNGKWFYTVFRHSMWPHPSPALPFTHYVASMWVAIQKYCLLSFCKKWLFCEPSAYENFSNQNKILYFKRGTFGGLFLGLGLCEGSCALDAVPSLRHLPQAPLLPLKETGDPGPSCPLSLFPQIPNPKVCILEHQSGTACPVGLVNVNSEVPRVGSLMVCKGFSDPWPHFLQLQSLSILLFLLYPYVSWEQSA